MGKVNEVKNGSLKKALKLLRSGKISFTKAAQVAQMNVWDFASLLQVKKLGWISDAVIKEDIEAAS